MKTFAKKKSPPGKTIRFNQEWDSARTGRRLVQVGAGRVMEWEWFKEGRSMRGFREVAAFLPVHLDEPNEGHNVRKLVAWELHDYSIRCLVAGLYPPLLPLYGLKRQRTCCSAKGIWRNGSVPWSRILFCLSPWIVRISQSGENERRIMEERVQKTRLWITIQFNPSTAG